MSEATSFKSGWLEEVVEAEWAQSECTVRLKIREIFSYDDDSGVVCLVCREAKTAGDFSTGRVWDRPTAWKLGILKRHLSTKMHLSSVQNFETKIQLFA